MMTKISLILTLLLVLPLVALSQGTEKFTAVKIKTTVVSIPGAWELLNRMDDSGQTYLQNDEGIIIAIAQNAKKA